MSDSHTLGELTAAVARIEQRQLAYEEVALRQLDTLAVLNEKLDAVLDAATREGGPSPVQELLTQILASLTEQAELLAGLPDALAETIRDELQRELAAEEPEMEEAGPESFADEEPGPRRDG